ncbi:hypothetical protein [Algoriphagus sp. Y33]|uniref:hypothetical protein n=1 Tax=Algoriphagus sp. Y33 TaxID=2772483 RepID=UPI00177F21AB|nr:hypothetical protein [Algoriphagus sp. Y33]
MSKKGQILIAFSCLVSLFLLSVISCNEPEATDKEEEKIFLLNELDEKPEFEGGYENFITYIIKGIQESPKGTFGSIGEKVFIDFVIDKEGNVSKVTLKTPLPLGIERELKSILEKSPTWKPGRVNGEPVSSFQTLPIKF